MENNYWSHFIPYQYSEEGKEGGGAQRGRKSSGVEKGRIGGRIPKGEELGVKR